jgi:hypothetical protein
MTTKLRWSIIGLALLTSFMMECFFVRFKTPLAFLSVIAVYAIGWAIIMSLHRSWRLHWPLFGLLPVALLSYAFLFRVDVYFWPLEALLVAGITLLLTSFIPLITERGAFLTLRSLPLLHRPFEIFSKGIALIKNFLHFKPQFTHTRQIITGVVISIPLLFIFGALFYSADSVFKEAVNQLGWLKNITELISWSWFSVIIRFTIWFILVGGLWSCQVAENYQAVVTPPKTRSVPQMTVLVIISLLSALFILFNLAQLSGLLFHSGLPFNVSYAEYAREGFGQLVAALFLACGLVLVLCRLYGQGKISRSTQVAVFIFLSQLIPLVFSAWHRLNLYQEAYGFTLQRLYAEWAIVGSLLVLPLFVLTVLNKLRYERIAQIVAVSAIMWISVCVVVGPSYLVAKRNLNRLDAGKDLDVNYLIHLSPDSIRAWGILKRPEVWQRLKVISGRNDQLVLINWLKELSKRLPYYALSERTDNQGSLWLYHPGELQLKIVIDDLLVSLK